MELQAFLNAALSYQSICIKWGIFPDETGETNVAERYKSWMEIIPSLTKMDMIYH